MGHPSRVPFREIEYEYVPLLLEIRQATPQDVVESKCHDLRCGNLKKPFHFSNPNFVGQRVNIPLIIRISLHMLDESADLHEGSQLFIGLCNEHQQYLSSI